MTIRSPRLTCDSDGKPLRRLRVTSKALAVEVFVLDLHGTPPCLSATNRLRCADNTSAAVPAYSPHHSPRTLAEAEVCCACPLDLGFENLLQVLSHQQGLRQYGYLPSGHLPRRTRLRVYELASTRPRANGSMRMTSRSAGPRLNPSPNGFDLMRVAPCADSILVRPPSAFRRLDTER